MADTPDLRILIVEDQALLAMELELVLAEFGCDIIGSAMDAEGALELASTGPVDLALVDVNLLDGFTGPEVARTLIEKHGAAVIFLTANPEQIPEGYAGALGAVVKPFDEATVRSAVAFAHEYIRHGVVAHAPRRFRIAPWLAPPAAENAPN